MRLRGQLNKHFCKNKFQISPLKQKNLSIFTFTIIIKTMENIICHNNQSSYPTGIKNIIYVEANVLQMNAKFQLMVSVKKIF